MRALTAIWKWRALLVGGGAFALYLYTTAPTVTYGGDCGELIAAAYTLGIAHPTGYPLYLLLGRLFASLPWGEVAFRLNAMSAMFAGLTVALLYLLTLHLTASELAAWVAALSLTFCYVFWTQAVIAEVYTLNTFLTVLLFLLHWQWWRTGDRRWFYLTALVFGLGAGNHLSVLHLLPASLVLLGVRERGLKRWLVASVEATCWFALGLLLYLYLPLRAAQHPSLNWGDPSTWERFWAHVTARGYREYMFALPWKEVGTLALKYGEFTAWQFPGIIVLSLWGLICLLRREKVYGLWLLWALGINVGFYLNYDVGDRINYFLPSYLLLALWAGYGTAEIEPLLRPRLYRFGWLGRGIISLAFISLASMRLSAAYAGANLRSNRQAREHAEQVIQAVPEKAVVLVESDALLFALWYLQQVEGQAPTVTFHGLGDLSRPGFRQRLWHWVSSYLERRPLFTAFWDEELNQRYALVPQGPVCRVLRQRPPLEVQICSSTLEPLHRWPGGLTLVRAELSASDLKTQTIATCTLFWQAPTPPKGQVLLFLARQADLIALQRKQPLDLFFEFIPAQRWWSRLEPLGPWPATLPPSACVRDPHVIAVPPGAVPGAYTVRVGFVPEGKERLLSARLDPLELLAQTVEIGHLGVIGK